MYKTFTELFYLLGFYFICFKIQNFFNPSNVFSKKVMLKVFEADPDNQITREILIKMVLPDILYILWCCIGLFTVNWMFFLLIFILLSVTTKKIHDMTHPSEFTNVVQIDAILSSVILLMILKSHYFHTWLLL